MTYKNDIRLFSIFMVIMLAVENCVSGKKISSENDDFFDREIIQGSSWRTVGYEEQNDPKNIFFSRIDVNEKSPQNAEKSSIFGEGINVDERNKRQADEAIVESGTVKINADIENELSTQQQESNTPDTPQVSTESFPSTTEIKMEENYSNINFIPINDFIRFRRELLQEARGETIVRENIHNRKENTQNFNVDNESMDQQSNRGPRGLTSQEWVKFPYQVQRVDSEDTYTSPNDFSKPRRVQFVTQKQFKVENPLSTNSRQGRVVDQSRDQPREPRIEFDVRKDVFTPRFRDYDGLEYPFKYSRGRYYERDLIDRRPDSRSFEMYPRNRDRRIIYYANLPEIPRISPRFRDMGRYREPFEDRYPGGHYQRAFYRDHRNEELQPMKVTADINVRDVKKNPEERIYSDVKRKYGYGFDADSTRH